MAIKNKPFEQLNFVRVSTSTKTLDEARTAVIGALNTNTTLDSSKYWFASMAFDDGVNPVSIDYIWSNEVVTDYGLPSNISTALSAEMLANLQGNGMTDDWIPESHASHVAGEDIAWGELVVLNNGEVFKASLTDTAGGVEVETGLAIDGARGVDGGSVGGAALGYSYVLADFAAGTSGVQLYLTENSNASSAVVNINNFVTTIDAKDRYMVNRVMYFDDVKKLVISVSYKDASNNYLVVNYLYSYDINAPTQYTYVGHSGVSSVELGVKNIWEFTESGEPIRDATGDNVVLLLSDQASIEMIYDYSLVTGEFVNYDIVGGLTKSAFNMTTSLVVIKDPAGTILVANTDKKLYSVVPVAGNGYSVSLELDYSASFTDYTRTAIPTSDGFVLVDGILSQAYRVTGTVGAYSGTLIDISATFSAYTVGVFRAGYRFNKNLGVGYLIGEFTASPLGNTNDAMLHLKFDEVGNAVLIDNFYDLPASLDATGNYTGFQLDGNGYYLWFDASSSGTIYRYVVPAIVGGTVLGVSDMDVIKGGICRVAEPGELTRSLPNFVRGELVYYDPASKNFVNTLTAHLVGRAVSATEVYLLSVPIV